MSIIMRQVSLLLRRRQRVVSFPLYNNNKKCFSFLPSSLVSTTIISHQQQQQHQHQQQQQRYSCSYFNHKTTTIASRRKYYYYHHHRYVQQLNQNNNNNNNRRYDCSFVLNRRRRKQQQQQLYLSYDNHYRQAHHRCCYYHELSYLKHGEKPLDVLQYKSDISIKDDDVPPPPTLYAGGTNNNNSSNNNNSMIKIQMLHVPWNPADVNTIQGKYPYPSGFTKPNFHQSKFFDNQKVIGSEGWGRVIHSSNSAELEEGSLVTFRQPGLGTLRSTIWLPESSLIKLPTYLIEKTGPAGCTLFQLGGTAYRMLHDFTTTLKRGEVIIQNGGNSGVGIMASQIAHTIFQDDVKVVSLIRRGSKTTQQFDNLVKYMKSVGKNTLVIAEEDLLNDKSAIKELQSEIKNLSSSTGTLLLPKLALNSIGGESSKLLLKLLDVSGTMVTYGGMSSRPNIEVSTPQFIFKDLTLKGYWHSRWMLQHQGTTEQQSMINALCDGVLNDHLVCPRVEVYKLKDYRMALDWHSNQTTTNDDDDGIRKKLVFDCQE